MQIQKIQNNSTNAPYFKGKIKLVNIRNARNNVVEKNISKAKDEMLHAAFLKATKVEPYSIRFGIGTKNSYYFEYLNKLKEILGVDLEEIANNDSKGQYNFSYSNGPMIKQPRCQISIDKGDEINVEHEFEFIYKPTSLAEIDKAQCKSRKTLSELCSRAEEAAQWADDFENKLPELSREMQMVPKYLELAKHEGKYRFNTTEIVELTGLAKMYQSEIPITDLVKQLLNIGAEKGKTLSAQEMKDFFKTTALMNKNEQVAVIKFMKSLKENVSLNDDYAGKTGKRTGLTQGEADTSKFINLKNLQFVRSITKCSNPETMAIIANCTDITSELESAPDLFVKMYEISNGNLGLIQDLSRCFYVPELDQIVSKLLAQKSEDKLSKYMSVTSSVDYHSPSFSSYGLSDLRDFVLYKLGLNGQIELFPLDYYVGIKTVDGSFEQGKRG